MSANSGYARASNEWYVEEPRCTSELLSVERFHGVTLDPSCGMGNIVTTMRALGHDAYGADIVDRCDSADWFLGLFDFLSDAPMSPDNIVNNPPFERGRGTEAFIRRALDVASDKVAIFAPLTFLAGQRRARGMFREFPPDRIWQIAQRPSCPPGEHILAGGTVGGGTTDFCWLIWDKTLPAVARGQARFLWITPP
jgi:hypothetical protein